MSDLLDNLIVGTTTGVASGVILAVFFWMRGRMTRFFERRDQVRHLRNLLAPDFSPRGLREAATYAINVV